MGQVTGHGNKLAFVEKGYIVLYDLTTNEERQVKMSKRPFISFSPDGMLLTCQSSYSGSLSLIDWATASVEEVIPYRESVCSCRFVTNTDVIVGFDVRAGFGVDYSHTRYRRYHWDGAKMQASTPGVVLPHNIFPSIKTPTSGLLHVSTNYVIDWPLRWKTILQWLESNKVPVARWFPKAVYYHFHVLNAQDQIVDEYYEPTSLNSQHPLFEQLCLERPRQEQGTTLRLWNHAPRWPNALATGMLVYLTCYVAMRCWMMRSQSQSSAI